MAEADFAKALSVLEAALPRTRKPEEIAKLQLMRGEALVALQRIDDAVLAFSAALTADPAATLDTYAASPDAVSAMETARAQFSSELAIQIAGGAAADVTVDGVELGPAPLKTRVGPGKHRAEAVASGGLKVMKEFDVLPGKPMQLSLDFAAAAAPLPPPPLPPPAEPPATRRVLATNSRSKLGFVPIGVGAAMIGAGVVCLVQSDGWHRELVDPLGPRLDGAAELRLAGDGSTYQTIGLVGIGVGAAAAVAGAAMLFLLPGSAERSVQLTAAVSPGGGLIGLTGSFEETRLGTLGTR